MMTNRHGSGVGHYLAEFQYRFNRRFNMKIILSRLLAALAAAPPSSERVLRAAEVPR
jgi:hypothetical protein